MLPNEVRIEAVRQHPAILVPAVVAALGGLTAAVAVNGFADHDALSRIAAWIVAAFFIGRLAITMARWAVSCVVITDERFMIISGMFLRRVQSIAIDDLRQMTFERSFFGRLTGYGTFIIDSGISQLVMDGVPFSEKLYLIVTSQIFGDGAKEQFDEAENADGEPGNSEGYDSFTVDDVLDL